MRYGPSQLGPNFSQAGFLVFPTTFLKTKSPGANGLNFHEWKTDTVYIQYNDNVVGVGSPRYDNAYFTINYVRVYTVDGLPSSVSSSLRHTNTLTVTSTDSRPTATGSTSGNAGVVFSASPLQLFVLFVVGAIAVVI